jgi:hypothetical protein
LFFGGKSLTSSFWKCENTVSPSLTYITVILHYLAPSSSCLLFLFHLTLWRRATHIWVVPHS